MSNLVVIGFDDETTAFEMRAELAKMQKEYLIEMEDVVVVTKDEDDKVKLHQAVNLTASGAEKTTFNQSTAHSIPGSPDALTKKEEHRRTGNGCL